MTAKQAIVIRCLDCFGRACPETQCPLFGLMKPKAGVNRIEAIRHYCYWCMNRNPINQCVSPNCSIYQYRAAAKGNISVSFLPILPSKNFIDDNGNQFHENDTISTVQKMETAEIVNSCNSRRIT